MGKDLACSGATTATQPYSSGNDFKPGLDFYDDGAGHQGQARLLQSYAASHNVKVVGVSIGGNDYNFAGIVSESGNVLGMMPHPERACSLLLGSSDGVRLLESILARVAA